MWPFTLTYEKDKTPNRLEEIHRRAERTQWDRENYIARISNYIACFSLALAAGASTAAIVAAFYAHGAYVQARRQADAAITPYIYGKFSNAFSIYQWITNRGQIEVVFHIQNFGQGPAVISGASCVPVWGTGETVDVSQLDSSMALEPKWTAQVLASKDAEDIVCENRWPVNNRLVMYHSGWPLMKTLSTLSEHPIWMLARVTYKDVSNTPHAYTVCVKYDIPGGANADDGTAFIPDGPSECNRHNDQT